jgi:hypothetical protein
MALHTDKLLCLEEAKVTIAWVLNTASLFAMAAGSLLFFLGLWEAPRSTDENIPPEKMRANLRSRRLLALGGGLLSLWFLMQYLSAIVM